MTIDRYLVFGNPIEHSMSPTIHAFFAKQTKQNIWYGKQLAPLDGFVASANNFFAKGGKGANVTLPFKHQALQLCTKVSERAKLAQAVNTLYLENDEICGDNTDGIGFIDDLARLNINVAKKNILLLGAGGAASGILSSIMQQKPNLVLIRNRNQNKAQQLATSMAHLGNVVAEDKADKNDKLVFDLAINATSLSLQQKLPEIGLKELANNAFCYDLAYNKSNTSYFTDWAKQHKLSASGGLGMLVGQAAASFYIWRKQQPNNAKCLQYLLKTTVE